MFLFDGAIYRLFTRRESLIGHLHDGVILQVYYDQNPSEYCMLSY